MLFFKSEKEHLILCLHGIFSNQKSSSDRHTLKTSFSKKLKNLHLNK